MKKIVAICLMTYIFGFAISFFFQLNKDTYTTSQTQKIDALFNNIQNKSSLERAKEIMSNNLFIISINIISALSLGGITLFNTFYNGFVFGYIIKISIALNDTSIFYQRIMPHSFEVIAIILSSIIGVYYGKNILCYMFEKEFKLANKQNVINYYLIPICLLLTVISAFIESYVSMG